MMIVDFFLLSLSIVLAFLIRFEGYLPPEYLITIQRHLLISVAIKIIVLRLFKLYSSLWEYASIEEMIQIFLGAVLANGGFVIYFTLIAERIPRSIFVIITIIDIMLLGGFRMSYRILDRMRSYGHIPKKKAFKRLLVIGAGDAGAMVVKELKKYQHLDSKPVALIDDDESKKGRRIHGVPILGTRKDIHRIAIEQEIDEIVIAIPSAAKKEIRDIVNHCKETDAKLRIVPGVYELIDGQVRISEIREVEIEDLLGREVVNLDTDNIQAFIQDKTVMVTGAGGSIGSELVRQIIKFKPQKLIMLEINENALYSLQHELKQISLKTVYVIASIRDADRLDYVFKIHRPDVVFHAAAHKHVPLMEENPYEAIKNNVFGTLNLAKIADKYKVKRFVQISTDKAVNPTNVMGATKRICEMMIQSFNYESETDFTAVRFGNVLGSNGSVIPLFKNQIKNGGPVTVTHPNIIRYFMTIPEAKQLVLQAGAMALGGEIFVLDMGEPVKIIDLAKDLIRLSGFIPYEDIDIEITGLRPGEKLFEELLLSEEGILKTSHQKIFIGKPVFIDTISFKKSLENLKNIINTANEQEIKFHLKKMVPEYHSQDIGTSLTPLDKVIHINTKKA